MVWLIKQENVLTFFVPLGTQPDLRAIKKRVVCAGSGHDFDVKQHLSVSVDVLCTIFIKKNLLAGNDKGFFHSYAADAVDGV